MLTKTSPPALVFEKVLRAFETGGFTYTDVVAQLMRLLASGASPTELLEILRREELSEPLPEHMRVKVFGILPPIQHRRRRGLPPRHCLRSRLKVRSRQRL